MSTINLRGTFTRHLWLCSFSCHFTLSTSVPVKSSARSWRRLLKVVPAGLAAPEAVVVLAGLLVLRVAPVRAKEADSRRQKVDRVNQMPMQELLVSLAAETAL